MVLSLVEVPLFSWIYVEKLKVKTYINILVLIRNVYYDCYGMLFTHLFQDMLGEDQTVGEYQDDKRKNQFRLVDIQVARKIVKISKYEPRFW